jgi:hypothetical protein
LLASGLGVGITSPFEPAMKSAVMIAAAFHDLRGLFYK